MLYKCKHFLGPDYTETVMQTRQKLQLPGDCEVPTDEEKAQLEDIKRIRAIGLEEGLPVVSEVSSILGERINRYEDHVGKGTRSYVQHIKFLYHFYKIYCLINPS